MLLLFWRRGFCNSKNAGVVPRVYSSAKSGETQHSTVSGDTTSSSSSSSSSISAYPSVFPSEAQQRLSANNSNIKRRNTTHRENQKEKVEEEEEEDEAIEIPETPQNYATMLSLLSDMIGTRPAENPDNFAPISVPNKNISGPVLSAAQMFALLDAKRRGDMATIEQIASRAGLHSQDIEDISRAIKSYVVEDGRARWWGKRDEVLDDKTIGPIGRIFALQPNDTVLPRLEAERILKENAIRAEETIERLNKQMAVYQIEPPEHLKRTALQ